MTYTYIVVVETDDKHVDAPDAIAVSNEIQNALEYDAPASGIERVKIRRIFSTRFSDYRDMVANEVTP